LQKEKKVRDLSVEKLFQVFTNKLNFNPADFLISSKEEELSNFQKNAIEKATVIMKDNIIEEVQSFGGNVKKNEEKFKEFEKKIDEELQKEEYSDIKKDLKDYAKKAKEILEKTSVAIIPVKEMPWMDVVFRTVPRLVFDKKIQLLDAAIAYYGEIKCEVSKPIIFGKIKDEEPLFAPIMGSIDLGEYSLNESEKGSKALIFPYITAIIKCFDSTVTKNHLTKYSTSFQRHGDPVCDFLMKNDELMKAMEKIISGIESNRIDSDIAILAIAIPHKASKTTLVLVTDEGEDLGKYTRCFEAFLRFSAECCNVPTQVQQIQGQMAPQHPSGMMTPGGQELKEWTADELALEAQKRMESQPDIPVWSEDDLAKFAEERGTGLPEGMEMWTEEDLLELARKRQGGLDIPEWTEDKSLKECVKCGYSLRPGWSKCPVCETPIDAKIESEPVEESIEEPGEGSEEESSEVSEEKENN